MWLEAFVCTFFFHVSKPFSSWWKKWQICKNFLHFIFRCGCDLISNIHWNPDDVECWWWLKVVDVVVFIHSSFLHFFRLTYECQIELWFSFPLTVSICALAVIELSWLWKFIESLSYFHKCTKLKIFLHSYPLFLKWNTNVLEAWEIQKWEKTIGSIMKMLKNWWKKP